MTDAVDDILNSLDMDQLAAQVGADPAEVERAVTAALPALFGGLNANAQDQAGAQSILQAGGIAADLRVLPGEPQVTLGHLVRDEAFDMLVMGVFGHSRIRSLLIGSTTAAMIHACRPCSPRWTTRPRALAWKRSAR